MSRQKKKIASPNGLIEAELSPASDDLLHLNGASLSLSGLPFGTRKFGWHGVWSSCSRYFAVTEFQNTECADGPDMHLVVIDVSRGQECVIERAECGFVEPISIRDGRVRYNKFTHDSPERIAREHKLAESAVWKAVSGGSPDAGEAAEQSGLS